VEESKGRVVEMEFDAISRDKPVKHKINLETQQFYLRNPYRKTTTAGQDTTGGNGEPRRFTLYRK